MTITVKTEDCKISLDNENLNNYNFVNITIDDKDTEMVIEAFPLDELLIALKAFEKLRKGT